MKYLYVTLIMVVAACLALAYWPSPDTPEPDLENYIFPDQAQLDSIWLEEVEKN